MLCSESCLPAPLTHLANCLTLNAMLLPVMAMRGRIIFAIDIVLTPKVPLAVRPIVPVSAGPCLIRSAKRRDGGCP